MIAAKAEHLRRGPVDCRREFGSIIRDSVQFTEGAELSDEDTVVADRDEGPRGRGSRH